MRVLVGTTAGSGHFAPLLPFAAACRRAGHDVLVAAPGSFASSVERAGFPFWPCEDIPEDVLGPVMSRLPGLTEEQARAVVVGEVFARLGAGAALPRMLAAVEEWRPDVILRETAEFASYVAAERHGLRQVRVAVGLGSLDELFPPVVLPPLAELRLSVGLSPDEDGARLGAAPCVTLTPASMEDPDAPGPERLRFREPAGDRSPAALPDWWSGSQEPLVYLTFGSVAGTLARFTPAYSAAIAAVAELPVRLLVTTGAGLDRSSLGSLPANVHVEQWVPQADVLPQAQAVVCHGGFNTVLGCLAVGVPMVVVPLFADQPFNAARVAALGAGQVVDPADAPQSGAAVMRVLENGSYRAAARRVADEIAALPPADEAVAVIEHAALH